jgi:lipopolysaccharide/colanic/teichoic acid biosynthesis glycosyltransferase
MLNFVVVKTLISIWDVFVAVVSPYVALLLRGVFTVHVELNQGFFIYGLTSCVATLVLLRVSGVSNAAWRFFSFPDATDAFVSIAMGVIVGVTVGFVHDRLEGVPRSLPFIHVIVQFAAYAGVRLVLKRLAAAYGRTSTLRPTYVLLIGCNQTSYVYARAIESIGRGSLKVAAALTHDPTMVGHTLRGIRVVATFDNIEAVIGKLRVHGVQIRRLIISAAENEISQHSLEKVLQVGRRLKIPVTDIHLLFTEVAGQGAYEDEFDIDVINLRGSYWLLKRSLDVVAASFLIFMLAPLFVLTALLVAFDLGVPLFFWQRRLGRHGKVFSVFKFRTMKDAISSSGDPVADAERTSSLGSMLRMTRLDELPQLWNILIGDMSFIGPRPLLPVDQPEEISQRLAARPGLSGWAQVNGGKLITAKEKRALDLWYIAHAGLWLDMRIVALTILVVVRGDVYNREAVARAVEWLKAHEESIVFRELS